MDLSTVREKGWSQGIDATLCLKGKVKWMQGKQRKKRKRREYTAAELVQVWDRWERGESSKAIAGALDRGATVYYLLLRYGGIRPRARCRSARALTLAEREEISRGIASGAVPAIDRSHTESLAIDAEPRDPAQRRPGSLSGLRGR